MPRDGLQTHSLVLRRLIKMRLLHTSSYKLHEFIGNKIPNYAILSHRWEKEEVSLYELEDGRALTMAGFAKIKGCCAQAALDGFQYVWIDTCCIDKTSSAELSEAINSMYLWYKNAQVCYAFLSDAMKGGDEMRHFSKSKWFTRGWTLQELLAPSYVVFYDCFWDEIGTKSSLEAQISSITGIRSSAQINQACVAEKMSWASNRETTRVEDMAYCLMGLFGVHMVPLYGEGHNAFIRLQLEILSMNDDESIFAWAGKYGNQGGLLASSPKAFEHSRDVRILSFDEERPQYSMTNKGLRLELFLTQSGIGQPSLRLGSAEYLAPLNCCRQGKSGDISHPIAIKLRQHHQNQYQRIYSNRIQTWIPPEGFKKAAFINRSITREVVHVKQPSDSESEEGVSAAGPYVFLLKTAAILQNGYRISDIFGFCPKCNVWNVNNIERPTLTIHKKPFCSFSDKSCGALLFSAENSESFALLLELGESQHAGAEILVPDKQQSLRDAVEVFYMERTRSHTNFHLDRVFRRIRGVSVALALRPVSRQEFLVEIGLNNRV